MATAKLSTKGTALSIRVRVHRAPAHLPSNVFSIGQARVNHSFPTYLKGRL